MKINVNVFFPLFLSQKLESGKLAECKTIELTNLMKSDTFRCSMFSTMLRSGILIVKKN